MADLIFLEPVFHEKIWGGRRLATELGYDIPDGPIGECWAISAHPHGDCVVVGGEYDGMHLSEVWDGHREAFGSMEGDRFPLLIKILDAEGDLSVQIHPDDAYAAEHENGSLGKRECWYVLDCEPDATIIVGQNAKDPEEFRAMVDAGRWDELLNELPIHKGDFFQIDPGTVHAIKHGTMILETQQSSDVTYRLYDYDRVTEDGTKRELHIDKSCDVVDYGVVAPASGEVDVVADDRGVAVLESNEDYTVETVDVDGSLELAEGAPFLCVSVIAGEGTANGHAVKAGSNFIVPSTVPTLSLEGSMRLVVSRP
ncbi:mannose-6-phosphate isomerase, class I [Caniella muris]|uniref:mannose-6-phosphate isomerase, class I n=1 Tax=Caniella muris TaxID=2941502 RepID=UPI00203C3035|nr:mannose-6-phosphate isomerase, class I [Caniella muris]